MQIDIEHLAQKKHLELFESNHKIDLNDIINGTNFNQEELNRASIMTYHDLRNNNFKNKLHLNFPRPDEFNISHFIPDTSGYVWFAKLNYVLNEKTTSYLKFNDPVDKKVLLFIPNHCSKRSFREDKDLRVYISQGTDEVKVNDLLISLKENISKVVPEKRCYSNCKNSHSFYF